MAISFRISSFEFNFFDFGRKNRDRSNNLTPDVNSMTDFVTINPDLFISFDFTNSPPNEFKDIEQVESKPVELKNDNVKDENQGFTRTKGKKHDNNDAVDNINKTLSRKFRREYREVKRENKINIGYELSHIELLTNELYLNRNQKNSVEKNSEDYKHKEKQKEKLDKNDIINDEIKRELRTK